MLLETALTDYILAIYRQWYALPYKATRIRLRPLLDSLAADLSTLPAFLAAIEQFPGVKTATALFRPALDAAMRSAATTTPPASMELRQLLTAPDPFALALARMIWQPSTLEGTLQRLRSRLVEEHARHPAGGERRGWLCAGHL